VRWWGGGVALAARHSSQGESLGSGPSVRISPTRDRHPGSEAPSASAAIADDAVGSPEKRVRISGRGFFQTDQKTPDYP